MSAERPGWEKLNAYVDGELAPHDRAEVAAAIAARPDLGRQVAVLTKLKATLGDGPAALGDGSATPAWDAVAPRLKSGGHRLARRLIAAGVIVAVGLGAAVVLAPWRATEDRTGWLAAPVSAHQAWVARGSPELPGSDAGALLVGLVTLGANADFPDLSATKLTITGARFVPAASNRPAAMHVAYSGTRGCRVTLWITLPPEAMDPALELHLLNGYRAYTWRAGSLAYALVSGMDPERFEVIARAARKVTIERAQPDVETATALRRSREQRPPCPTA